MEVSCEVCGIVFDKPPHRFSRTRTGKHYCSKECYNKEPIRPKRTGEFLICSFCGKTFYRTKSQIALTKSDDNFCSKKCRGSFIKERTQENKNATCSYCGREFHLNPTRAKRKNNYCSRDCWKRGIESSGPPKYRRKKKTYCEICGFVAQDKCQLDVHHFDVDKTNNSDDNLLTLCANCHRLVHRKLNYTTKNLTTGQTELALLSH